MTELNTKLNDFLSKYVNNKSLYIIIIIGIVFMLLPTFGSEKNENSKQLLYDEYSDEARLSEILSKVYGAGKRTVPV